MHGYDSASKYRRAAEVYFRRIDVIKRVPFDCLEKLDMLVPELLQAARFREAKKTTEFGQDMLRRAMSGSPKAAEVVYRTKQIQRGDRTRIDEMVLRDVDVTDSITSLQFWTKDFDTRHAESALEEARALTRSARQFDPDDTELALSLERRCRALEGDVRLIAKDVELCRSFLRPENMRLAHLGVRAAVR